MFRIALLHCAEMMQVRDEKAQDLKKIEKSVGDFKDIVNRARRAEVIFAIDRLVLVLNSKLRSN